MKPSVIREMTLDEVRDKLTEESATLVKMKLNHTVSPLENPLALRTKRRLIARLSSEIRQRENNS